MKNKIQNLTKIGILGIILIVGMNLASGATYYVDSKNGNDNNTGLSESSAIKSIGKVNTLILNPGDSVLFKREGIWREALIYNGNSGTSSSRITFGAYGTGNKPKIYGSIDGENQNLWTSIGNSKWATPSNSVPLEAFMIFYNTNNAEASMGNRKTAQSQLLNNWDFFWDSSQKRIIVFQKDGSPNSQANGLEIPAVGKTQNCLIFNTAKNYITFKDLDIRYARFRGLCNSGGSFVDITNVDIKYNYEKAIYQGADATSNNININNCQFFQTGLRGTVQGGMGETIWVQNTDTIFVKNNILKKPHGVAINFWHSKNIIAENNRIENCDQELADWSSGIYFDGCSNSLAQHNTVSKCTIGLSVNSEIDGYISRNVTFQYNTIAKNMVSLVVNSNLGKIDNHDIKVIHNTFYRNSYTSGFYPDVLVKYFNSIIFRDNIVFNDYSDNKGALLLWEKAASSGFKSDYNIWKSGVGRNIFQISSSNEHSSLAQFVQVENQDTHSKSENPRFTDAANGDYRPLAGSPACTMSSTGSYIGALPCTGPTPNRPPTQTTPILKAFYWQNNASVNITCYNQTTKDPDGDKVSNIYKWYRNSAVVPEYKNNTLVLRNFSQQTLVCEITPFDGKLYGKALNSTSLTIKRGSSCGDGVCGSGENCSTCPADCKPCPVPNATPAQITACKLNNLAWNEDEILKEAFNLNSCFKDPLNSQLSFKATGQNKITVSIQNGIVNLHTPADWSGSESVYFTATSGSRSAKTNTIVLSVSPLPDCGDNICESGESCSSCSIDCGSCPAGSSGGGGSSSRLITEDESKSNITIGVPTTTPQDSGKNNNPSFESELTQEESVAFKDTFQVTKSSNGETHPIIKSDWRVVSESPITGNAISVANQNPWLILLVIVVIAFLCIFIIYPEIKIVRGTSVHKKNHHQIADWIDFIKDVPQIPAKHSIINFIMELGYEAAHGEQVYKYLKVALDKGYDWTKIRYDLLNAGWDRSFVDKICIMCSTSYGTY